MIWLHRLFGRGRQSARAILATVQKEAGNVCVLRVGGMLNLAAMERIQAVAAQVIARGAKDLRVLLILNDFKGWKHSDSRGESAGSMRDEGCNAKIAVVGDARWQTPTLAFLTAGHRLGKVCYFTPEQEPQARAWLTR
jgi:hypothetical protein